MKRVYILILLILIAGCSKSIKLTDTDVNYLMTFEDFKTNKKFGAYKLIPIIENGNFIFSKRVFFGTTIISFNYLVIDDHNHNIIVSISAIRSSDNKKNKINFENNKKNINSENIKIINPDEFNCLEGYYINSSSNKILQLKREKLIYSITLAGKTDIDLFEYKDIIKRKIDNFQASKL